MMVYYTTVQSQIMYGKESTWGTAVATPNYFGRSVSFSFDQSNNLIEDYDIGSRTVKNLPIGPFDVTGSISFNLIDFSVFEFVLGSKSGSGTGADPYVYSVLSTGVLPSATIECGHRGTTSDGYIIDGAMCNSATISFSQGEVVKVDTNWIGRKAVSVQSLTSYTTPTTAPFTYLQGLLKRDGSTIGIVQSGSITFTNNLISARGLGDRLLQYLSGGQFKTEYEFTVVLDSAHFSTLKSDFYGQSASSGPINSGTGLLAGNTITLELSNGATRVATVSLTIATSNTLKQSADTGNNVITLVVNGIATGTTITEQVTA